MVPLLDSQAPWMSSGFLLAQKSVPQQRCDNLRSMLMSNKKTYHIKLGQRKKTKGAEKKIESTVVKLTN